MLRMQTDLIQNRAGLSEKAIQRSVWWLTPSGPVQSYVQIFQRMYHRRTPVICPEIANKGTMPMWRFDTQWQILSQLRCNLQLLPMHMETWRFFYRHLIISNIDAYSLPWKWEQLSVKWFVHPATSPFKWGHFPKEVTTSIYVGSGKQKGVREVAKYHEPSHQYTRAFCGLRRGGV